MLSYLCLALVFVAACNADTPTGAPKSRSNTVCKQRNAYYKVDSSCDLYIKCIDFTPTDMACPDGLHYNPDVEWPGYPCGYPMDVPCRDRGAAQPAQPTAECPHQYGYFASPVASPDNCGQYRMCVAGKGIEMSCPTGLAFNPNSGRCDWPDQVPSCKANVYLGFTCPPVPNDTNGNPIEIANNYKYEGNCYYFYSCLKGHARLLMCDPGMAFDPASGRCVDADYVNCAVTTAVDAVPNK